MLTPILLALLPLFVLIGLGYVLRRWSVLHHEHVPVLNGLVLQVLLPAAILRTLLQAPPLSAQLMALPAMMLACEAAVALAIWPLAHRAGVDRKTIGALLLTAAFGNTAFLGYPVAQALIPHQFPATVVTDQFGMMLSIYPLAAVLGAYSGAGGSERLGVMLVRFARGPLFMAIVIGLSLRQVPVSSAVAGMAIVQALASLVWQCLGYLAQATTPVVLLALGVALQPRAGGASPKLLGVAILTKLLVCPLIVIGLCGLAHIPQELRMVVLLQAAMPSAVLGAVLSAQYGMDGRFAVRVVCYSTALSVITIPLMVMLGR